MMIKFYHHYLICKYDFTCSLFQTTCKLKNDRKVIPNLYFSNLSKIFISTPLTPKAYTDEDFRKVISFFSYNLLKSLPQAKEVFVKISQNSQGKPGSLQL